MLDRLKSLPLTIVLTVLIWMYAESQVTHAPGSARWTVDDVPVLVSGPPEVVSPINVQVSPDTVSVTVSGPEDVIESLKDRVARGGVKDSGIFAYLDVEAGDEPNGEMFSRQLRYSFPDGVTLNRAPPPVTCRITRAGAATAPK